MNNKTLDELLEELKKSEETLLQSIIRNCEQVEEFKIKSKEQTLNNILNIREDCLYSDTKGGRKKKNARKI